MTICIILATSYSDSLLQLSELLSNPGQSTEQQITSCATTTTAINVTQQVPYLEVEHSPTTLAVAMNCFYKI